ncbi:MAG TPA: alpha/beta fold hydrolase [Acidimicrobiales bacterium]|jgi:pimeloyl-ACP methyl ester carboxylesterase
MADAFVDLNGIRICYETFGDPSDPTLLLVMGLGSPMTDWDDDLCHLFVDRGFHVVRFDNRDAGLSTFLPEPVDLFAVLGAINNGDDPGAPYLLADMADDAIGLLDHLGVAQAHVVGISLGGMIAQTMALDHPSRLATLTSIMSTPGPDVAPPAPEALQVLLGPPAQNVEEAMDRSVVNASIWGSPELYTETEVRERARRNWERHYDPNGSARQLAAILASGDRTERLRSLEVPTLVIHGTADTLIPQVGGEATAAAVPDAKLLIIEGMGHDLALPLWSQLVEAITGHAAQHQASV